MWCLLLSYITWCVLSCSEGMINCVYLGGMIYGVKLGGMVHSVYFGGMIVGVKF